MKTKKAIETMTFPISRTSAGSDSLLNLSSLQARGAHSHTLHGSIDHRPNFLKVWEPSAGRSVICVAHVVSRNRLFAAYFTCFCHNVQIFLSFTSLISTLKYAKFRFYAILFSKLFCRIHKYHHNTSHCFLLFSLLFDIFVTCDCNFPSFSTK